MRIALIASLAAAAALVGCGSINTAQTGTTEQGAPTTQAAAPAAVPPGMNDKGEVIDSTKVEPGSGTKVKGIDGFEGEIVGKPAKNGKFAQLQIGMSDVAAMKILGEPSAKAKRNTNKIYIPMYTGRDRSRLMMVYKGQGRVVFSGGPFGNENAYTLLYVIHNANEGASF